MQQMYCSVVEVNLPFCLQFCGLTNKIVCLLLGTLTVQALSTINDST